MANTRTEDFSNIMQMLGIPMSKTVSNDQTVAPAVASVNNPLHRDLASLYGIPVQGENYSLLVAPPALPGPEGQPHAAALPLQNPNNLAAAVVGIENPEAEGIPAPVKNNPYTLWHEPLNPAPQAAHSGQQSIKNVMNSGM